MRRRLVDATITAIKEVNQPRYFCTERGYHGRFYCALQKTLDRCGILTDEVIAEMEYQKSERHGLGLRPDIVIHKPAELDGESVRQGNLAVYALKRQASEEKASKDFTKLEQMFNTLRYRFGFFINIDSGRHHLEQYAGEHREQIHAFAVQLIDGHVSITHASYAGDRICETRIE